MARQNAMLALRERFLRFIGSAPSQDVGKCC
jgi:hypothetical protein